LKITEKEVRYVAELANLSLAEAEVKKFQLDLNEILAHVDRLNDVDTTGIEPMTQVLYQAEGASTWRPDRQRPPLGTEAALANAPAAGAGYFKVPRVIER
jgi:aspartyl-tRNA(Asn)/glutamyl-tRNA(Gln) amidotransferase subunit C